MKLMIKEINFIKTQTNMKKITLLLILASFNIYCQAPKEKEKIQLKIDLLEKKVDSINQSQILDKAQYRVERELEIVNQVSDFFNHSVGFIIFLLGVVGVLTPLLINWYQNILVRNANKKLLEDYDSRIANLDSKFQERNTELKSLFESKMIEINVQLDSKSSELTTINRKLKNMQFAMIYYTQGHAAFLSKDYVMALYNLLLASYHWSIDGNHNETDHTLHLVSLIIGQITKEMIRDVEIELRLYKDNIKSINDLLLFIETGDLSETSKKQMGIIKGTINAIK